jgi:hypothetical protein
MVSAFRFWVSSDFGFLDLFPFSGFGFLASFGFRTLVFGFQALVFLLLGDGFGFLTCAGFLFAEDGLITCGEVFGFRQADTNNAHVNFLP